MSEVDTTRKEGIGKEESINPTAVLKIFIDEMTQLPEPLILDLGCICDSNIEFFIHLGCKVFVKDFLNANARAFTTQGNIKEISVDELQIDFEYPEKFFDGILLWDLFDNFGFEEAHLILNKARGILKDKGWAIALFRPAIQTPFNTITRFRIVSSGEVRYEALPLITQRQKIYYNRDIAELFSNFSPYSSYMLKNRWREVIVRK